MTAESTTRRIVGVVLFDGFELLDVFGPLEVFGMLPESYTLSLIGPAQGPVSSAQGPQAVADAGYHDAATPDVVLVPGGRGTRPLMDDREFLDWLRDWASAAEVITSVCTGSALLAAAGLLDGYRATSNKQAFEWVRGHSSTTEWVERARWVEHGNRWTSSGVSAGIDMALALVSHQQGRAVAEAVAAAIEFDWHRDASWDPFARPAS